MATEGTVTYDMALALLVDLHDRPDEEKGDFWPRLCSAQATSKLALPGVFEKSVSLCFRNGPLATDEASCYRPLLGQIKEGP